MLARSLLAPVCAVLVGALGCGTDPNKEYPVQLTVTLDGAPLREGSVYILPADGRGAAGVELADGALTCNVIAGTHRVEVRAYRVPPGVTVPPGTKPGALVPDPFVNYIPARYNVASELSVQVTPDGPNDFKLDLRTR